MRTCILKSSLSSAVTLSPLAHDYSTIQPAILRSVKYMNRPTLYPRSLIIPPYRYHQRYSSSMVGSRIGGKGAGRRLVMPPGAPIGPMSSSARHGARTSILDLDYSAKVNYANSPRLLCCRLCSGRSAMKTGPVGVIICPAITGTRLGWIGALFFLGQSPRVQMRLYFESCCGMHPWSVFRRV